MYRDLRACTTAWVNGVFCGGVGGDSAASDAIPLAGDSVVGAETATGNGLEEQALAEVGAPLVLGQVRMVTAGERLLDGDEAGPAIARRRGGEGGTARRSRVMRQVIASAWKVNKTDVDSSGRAYRHNLVVVPIKFDPPVAAVGTLISAPFITWCMCTCHACVLTLR